MSQMMSKAVYDKRQPKGQQPTYKGCCCKRSQCIKNYCDCYQSMAICTKFCKCIGCRNTEVRKVVNSGPVKSASSAKRERAAAMTAKAAAAAAKAGIDVSAKAGMGPMPNVLGSAAGPGFMCGLQMPYGFMNAQPSPAMNLVPGPNVMNMPAMTPFPAQPFIPQITTMAPVAVVSGARPSQFNGLAKPQLPPEPTDTNILTPQINAALLDCMYMQAADAEEAGLEEVEVGQLVMHEFACGLTSIMSSMPNQ
ncbi:CRC domain-containing protein TSO1 [Scaptodrosophila lebanonensis]|uniref:CRC domain-containing protein TSO1 n=1 Tax=Drosophila lebanonensis TaxID=7225 RepID=A0A6J2TVS4_DROLE|nr:CRC domain-containing protein TSO1 [Scaptodrosophila lebanonensis]